MSGRASERVAVVTASARNLPAQQVGNGKRGAAIGHVHHADASHHLEQLAGHMHRCSVTTRRIVDLSGIGFSKGNELGNRLGWEGWIYFHNEGHTNGARDRNDVADKIVAEIVVEGSVDRVRRTDLEKRVAVGRSAHDDFGANSPAGTGPVLDHEGPTEPLR